MAKIFVFIFIFLCFVDNLLSSSQLNSGRCHNNQFECNNGACIDKEKWCKRRQHRGYCNDKSDVTNCNLFYPNCASDQAYCKDDRNCIPMRWFCDGYQDCPDESDESDCLEKGYRIIDIPNVRASLKRGREWLLKNIRKDWSWGKDTSRAIISLLLSDEWYPNFIEVTTQLMIKQMKLQLSEKLLMYDVKDIKTHEMALYVHSLLATCSDPRIFQGVDLVKMLEDRANASRNINPLAALAICSSDRTFPLTKLKNIYIGRYDPQWIDTEAYAIMAMICIYNRWDKDRWSDDDNPMFRKIDSKLYIWNQINNKKLQFARLQKQDGSFGNIYTTAILFHALLAAERNKMSTDKWNIRKSVDYFITQQKEDGSFGDILSTYLVLPLLNGKTFFDLGNVNCSVAQSDSKNTTIRELDYEEVEKHRVKYSIFVGKDMDIIFSLSLNVPINFTFFDIMRLAEELDHKFRFKYVDYPMGKLVYSIFGLVNRPEEGKYWGLYKITHNETVLQNSPEEVIPAAEEEYAYWYTFVDDQRLFK